MFKANNLIASSLDKSNKLLNIELFSRISCSKSSLSSSIKNKFFSKTSFESSFLSNFFRSYFHQLFKDINLECNHLVGQHYYCNLNQYLFVWSVFYLSHAKAFKTLYL